MPPAQGMQDLLSSNASQLQTLMQLTALLNSGLGAQLLNGNPLIQQQQFPQSALPNQPPAQTVPSLMSLLGMQPNAAANGVNPPVGSCDNDEEFLIAALRESTAKGLTYRKALENLHEVRPEPPVTEKVRIDHGRPSRSMVIVLRNGKTITSIMYPE